MRKLNGNCIKVDPGTKFHYLTVIKEVDGFKQPSGIVARAFLCKCKCGKEKVVRLSHLRHNKVKTCGCLHEHHNMSSSRMYNIWRAMKDRCYSKSSNRKKYYQDRNIVMCDEWKNSFTKFMKWSDKNGYNDSLTIDRIDNMDDYKPSNCRWVTPRENTLSASGQVFRYHGKSYYFTILAELLGKENHKAAIRGRIKRGYSIDEAFDKPIRKGNYRR